MELSRHPIGVGVKRTSRRMRRRTREERSDLGELLRLHHNAGGVDSHQPTKEGVGGVGGVASPSTLTWRGPELRITLGRGEGCDVRILGETVSRLHCEIERVGPVYQLRDRSRNGTWVNGSRIDQCQLQNGDWIRVGEDDLRVDLVPIDKSTDRLVGRRTVDPTSGLLAFEYALGHEPEEVRVALELSPSVVTGVGEESSAVESLVLLPQIVIRGLEAGVTLQFWNSRIAFGRWKANEVVLVGEKISRIHAALVREESAYVLVDLESTNGTFVNEQRITRCAIQTGDRVRMGSYQALVRLDQGDCLLHFQPVSL